MKLFWKRFIESDNGQCLQFICFLFFLPVLIIVGLITRQIKLKDLL